MIAALWHPVACGGFCSPFPRPLALRPRPRPAARVWGVVCGDLHRFVVLRRTAQTRTGGSDLPASGADDQLPPLRRDATSRLRTATGPARLSLLCGSHVDLDRRALYRRPLCPGSRDRAGYGLSNLEPLALHRSELRTGHDVPAAARSDRR